MPEDNEQAHVSLKDLPAATKYAASKNTPMSFQAPESRKIHAII
jgi:hypothetical protein